MAGLSVPPANASAAPSRESPHASGPECFATSFPYRPFIDYLLPAWLAHYPSGEPIFVVDVLCALLPASDIVTVTEFHLEFHKVNVLPKELSPTPSLPTHNSGTVSAARHQHNSRESLAST